MAIRCGHCHQSHSTVADVRQCAIDTKARATEAWIRAQHPGRDIQFSRNTEARAPKTVTFPRTGAKVTEAGFYRRGANVYEVIRSKEGRLYAKSLNREATTKAERWTYEPGSLAYLRPDMKMDRDEAQQFGRETGICISCSAELTHPVSIERGMGPTCYGKWYDEN